MAAREVAAGIETKSAVATTNPRIQAVGRSPCTTDLLSANARLQLEDDYQEGEGEGESDGLGDGEGLGGGGGGTTMNWSMAGSAVRPDRLPEILTA